MFLLIQRALCNFLIWLNFVTQLLYAIPKLLSRFSYSNRITSFQFVCCLVSTQVIPLRSHASLRCRGKKTAT